MLVITLTQVDGNCSQTEGSTLAITRREAARLKRKGFFVSSFFTENLTKRHSDRNLALRICHEDSAPAAQIHALVSDRGLAPSSSEMTSNDGIPLVVSGGVSTAPAQAQADVTTTPDFCSLIPAFLMGTLCMLNIIP